MSKAKKFAAQAGVLNRIQQALPLLVEAVKHGCHTHECAATQYWNMTFTGKHLEHKLSRPPCNCWYGKAEALVGGAP